MMFSKLSGRSIATHVPSVTSPASVSGASVSRTSATRRSANASRIVIDSSAHRPACRNALHDGAARLLDADRRAGGVGRDLPHRGREALQRRVVVGIALGEDLDARTSVRRHPVALQVRGQAVASVTASACSASRSCASVTTSPGTTASRARSRAAGSALASDRQRLGQPRRRRRPRRRPARIPPPARVPAPCAASPHGFRVAGRWFHVERIERGVEQHRGIARAARAWRPAAPE